jgi:hypothetical protein
MDKQILDRIKKSEQRVVDLYAKVKDLNTTVYGGGGTQGLKEQYTILQIDPDNDTDANRGKALKDLYQKIKDRNENSSSWIHTILVPPGDYYFQDGEPLVLDYEGINVVSLTGEPDVFISVRYDSQPFAINELIYSGAETAEEFLDTFNFSETVGNNVYGSNYGVDSQGVFFNDVDQGDEDGESYPIRFGLVNTNVNDYLNYNISFIQEDNCSDLGFAIWQEGSTPQWNWGEDHFGTLFKVQINCEDTIEIVGFSSYDELTIPGGLTIGHTYMLIINMEPSSGFLFVGLYDQTTGSWVVSDNYSPRYAIPTGYNIIAGIAADSDEGSTIHITYLNGPNDVYTTYTPCLSVETSNVTVRGIVGKRDSSSNWGSWSELDYDYNLPIFVDEGLANVVIENCIGGPFSFGADPEFNGNGQYNSTYTFKNCRAPQGYSFGYGVEDYEVTAIGCNSLNYYGSYSPRCFDVDDELYVTVIDCHFGDYSFRGYEIDITVKDTEVGSSCFGADGYFEGNFENVTTGEDCFNNGNGSIYGIYRNCKVGTYCFSSYDSIYADFYNCYFIDASNLDQSNATCHFCINDDYLENGTATVGYASYNVNIND